MTTLYLEVRAPFAAFRWMQAGVFRGTSPVIPPSTAWGLVCNLAGIEVRAAGNHVVTPIRPDAPSFELAVGRFGPASEVASLYQQLHSYPVGSSGKELGLDQKARGAKYWITPVRRELLVDPHLAIAVRAPDHLCERVLDALDGRSDRIYGLPFLGDNNLLIDRLEVSRTPARPATWFERWTGEGGARRGSCRLTVRIDRERSASTRTELFAPVAEPTLEPPDLAWCSVGPG